MKYSKVKKKKGSQINECPGRVCIRLMLARRGVESSDDLFKLQSLLEVSTR